jgi:hypothetical protein
MACQEKTEVRLEEEKPASRELKPAVADEEVPREDAAVMPVGGLRKQCRGQKQATGRREQPKKLHRGICGSREKLAAACRKMSHCATVAWRTRNILRQILTHGSCRLRKEVTAAGMKITRCAGHSSKGQNKDVERETRKGRTEQNERWRGPVCENGISNRGLKQQLCGKKQIKDPTMKNIEGWNPGKQAPLGNGVTRKDICDIFREKIMGHGVGISSELRRRKKLTLWRGRPPPKRKEQH